LNYIKKMYQNIYNIFIYCRAFFFIIFIGVPSLIIMFCFPSSIYKLGKFLSKGIFKSFSVKYNLDGEFPSGGPYVIMHNHSSFLDMFFLPMVIKGKYTGIIAAKNFKIPIIGLLLNRMKGIPIERSNKTHAIKGIELAQERLKEGYHIAIFPEGTRTITGKLSKLKKGGFHMAKNAKAKILPIIVKGLYEIKPKTRWTLNTNIVAKMIIKEPIDTMHYSVDELKNKIQSIFIDNGLEV